WNNGIMDEQGFIILPFDLTMIPSFQLVCSAVSACSAVIFFLHLHFLLQKPHPMNSLPNFVSPGLTRGGSVLTFMLKRANG
ncbi:MAG: hypothetical protein NTX30_12525, partial [Deltaproteobacteria bacterium]|nr:hypothetical protein [Deltaproteobacteria bacterium]